MDGREASEETHQEARGADFWRQVRLWLLQSRSWQVLPRRKVNSLPSPCSSLSGSRMLHSGMSLAPFRADLKACPGPISNTFSMKNAKDRFVVITNPCMYPLRCARWSNPNPNRILGISILQNVAQVNYQKNDSTEICSKKAIYKYTSIYCLKKYTRKRRVNYYMESRI